MWTHHYLRLCFELPGNGHLDTIENLRFILGGSRLGICLVYAEQRWRSTLGVRRRSGIVWPAGVTAGAEFVQPLDEVKIFKWTSRGRPATLDALRRRSE